MILLLVHLPLIGVEIARTYFHTFGLLYTAVHVPAISLLYVWSLLVLRTEVERDGNTFTVTYYRIFDTYTRSFDIPKNTSIRIQRVGRWGSAYAKETYYLNVLFDDKMELFIPSTNTGIDLITKLALLFEGMDYTIEQKLTRNFTSVLLNRIFPNVRKKKAFYEKRMDISQVPSGTLTGRAPHLSSRSGVLRNVVHVTLFVIPDILILLFINVSIYVLYLKGWYVLMILFSILDVLVVFSVYYFLHHGIFTSLAFAIGKRRLVVEDGEIKYSATLLGIHSAAIRIPLTANPFFGYRDGILYLAAEADKYNYEIPIGYFEKELIQESDSPLP